MPDARKATRRAAIRHGINPNILEALINQESGFREGVSSPAGARDIAQFIPSTAKQYGVTLGDGRIRDDLDGAARYIADNLKRTGGDYRQALSIYNSGDPQGYKKFGETANYVKSILGGIGPRSANPGRSVASGTGLTYGTTSITAEDPELQRKQFFAQWFAQHNPASPLVRLGVVDPEMSTKTTVKIPTVTGLKSTSAGGRHPVTGRPGGSYAGTTGIVTDFSSDAHAHGLTTSSGKRDTMMTASGNVSDHYRGKKNANARDWSGEVANMDRFARHLQKRLGLRDWKGVQTTTKQIGDHVYRFQMLYRTNVGGDHFNHLHLGVERVE